LEIPRFGWRFENTDPMITESVTPHLQSYPLERASYRVKEPVALELVSSRSPFAPKRVTLFSKELVTFGPPVDFLTGNIEVAQEAGDSRMLRVGIDAYAQAAPRRLKIGWYLRDAGAGGDWDRPVRGVVTLARGESLSFDTTWQQANQPTHDYGVTLVLLSLNPAAPGHAEYGV
jgi:hypothetical protein